MFAKIIYCHTKKNIKKKLRSIFAFMQNHGAFPQNYYSGSKEKSANN